MNKESKSKIFIKIKAGIILTLSFCFIADAQSKLRTIYYLPYSSYSVSYTGNVHQSYMVIFLGTVRSTTCYENLKNGYQGEIQKQFTKHIESNYRSKLGVKSQWTERIGYWRWENGEKELLGMYSRIAKRYPKVVYVTTFFYNCGASIIINLRTGFYKSSMGDSARIKNLGGGKFYFEAWKGSKAKPVKQYWYNRGTGIVGKNGLIYCLHNNVPGYASPNQVTESYWKIVSVKEIKQVKYRVYPKNRKPLSQNQGWRSGPTFLLIEKYFR